MCEIGSFSALVGDIYPVKVVGLFGMIDQGETNWKVIAMACHDPLAPLMHCTSALASALAFGLGFAQGTFLV